MYLTGRGVPSGQLHAGYLDPAYREEHVHHYRLLRCVCHPSPLDKSLNKAGSCARSRVVYIVKMEISGEVGLCDAVEGLMW